MLLAEIGQLTYGISGAVALSAVAVVGYLFGRSQRSLQEGPRTEVAPTNSEVQRAMQIAGQLEEIADSLRQDLARHRSQVDHFKSKLREEDVTDDDAELWTRLRGEADAMVSPTLELVSQLSSAYDKIRMHSQSLANFSGGRTDQVTGLANSRALEEHLEVLLRSRRPDTGEFSLVIVSLDGPAPEGPGHDRRVILVGQQLADGLRGDDFAARIGVDEFVVVLPATTLDGAGIFATRLRSTVENNHGLTVCCGLAESMPADTPKSLLARADSAVYSARAAGPGQQYLHNGASIRPDHRSGEVAGEKPEASASPAPVVTALPELPGPEVAGSLMGSAAR